MQTNPLFHHDSYLKEAEATVLLAEENRIALDQTIFYAQSGGQLSDYGTVEWPGGNANVIHSTRDGGLIWHQIEGQLPPSGTRLTCKLDWDRRYSLMRSHTALHILCGVIWRDWGAKVTGCSMDMGIARMDFELEQMSATFAEEVEEKTNAEIAARRNIHIRFLSREEAMANPDLIRTKINLLPEGILEVRVIEIEGLDLQADGGTHLANTAEVGRIHITGHESKGKINKRLRLSIENA